MNPDQQIELYRAARSIAWSYRLQDYSEAALKDMQRVVDKSKDRIVDRFESQLGAIQREGSYTRQHYQASLKELDRLSLGLRNQLGEQLTDSTSRIGSLALREWSENLSVGGVAKTVNTVALSPEQFKAFFTKNPPAGILIPKVMRNAMNRSVQAQVQQELLDVLREGALTGQSYKRIVDTLARSFTDFNRTQLTTLTRTFFQTANAQAFDAVYAANQDIVEGKIWTNVNDDRVCLLCLPLGEVLYKKEESHPPMPRHPNCRCVFRAKTVSYRSLGVDVDELEEVASPVVTRGYMKNGKWIIPPAGTGTGRRPRSVSFYKGGMKEAFPDLPEAQQKAMLGVGRYNLYKAGDLTIDQLVDPESGKLYLLRELQAGEHLRAPMVPTTPVVAPDLNPPMTRPTIDEVEERWLAVKASEDFQKKQRLKDKLDKQAREAKREYDEVDAKYKEILKKPNPPGSEAAELRNAKREIGSKVFDLNDARRQLAKELKQYQHNKFTTIIYPTKNKPVPVVIDKKFLRTKANKNSFEAMKEAASQMLHEKVVEQVDYVRTIIKRGARAYYRDSSSEICLASLMKKDTFIHEFGHAIEHNIPAVGKAAREFRRRRVGNEKMTVIYKGTEEMGWKDEFFSHYCGKYYRHGATEIVSMGLEKMYKDPIEFFESDPDYFDFILKVMWGDV